MLLLEDEWTALTLYNAGARRRCVWIECEEGRRADRSAVQVSRVGAKYCQSMEFLEVFWKAGADSVAQVVPTRLASVRCTSRRAFWVVPQLLMMVSQVRQVSAGCLAVQDELQVSSTAAGRPSFPSHSPFLRSVRRPADCRAREVGEAGRWDCGWRNVGSQEDCRMYCNICMYVPSTLTLRWDCSASPTSPHLLPSARSCYPSVSLLLAPFWRRGSPCFGPLETPLLSSSRSEQLALLGLVLSSSLLAPSSTPFRLVQKHQALMHLFFREEHSSNRLPRRPIDPSEKGAVIERSS